MLKLKNGNVITPYRIKKNTDIICSDEKIIKVNQADDTDCKEIDLTGLNVSPGFIDIHIHGGGGHEFWTNREEEIIAAGKFHAMHGTTSVVPTINYGRQLELNEEIKAKFDAFSKAKASTEICANLLGLHMEGPNISPKHPMEMDQQVNPALPELYNEFIEYACRNIIRWTVAPEIPGVLKMIEELSRKGVYISLGHSEPDIESVYNAYEAGASHITHFYSGMNMVHRVNGTRYAGLLETAFLIDALNVEVIANGSHLSGELIKLIYNIKGAEHICVVSDASSASGTPDGPIIYNGQKGFISNGAILRENKSGFLGSAITYDKMLYNLINTAGIPLTDSVRMCTASPARSLGLSKTKGVIAPGFDADIIAFDDDINIKFVMIKGKILFQN